MCDQPGCRTRDVVAFSDLSLTGKASTMSNSPATVAALRRRSTSVRPHYVRVTSVSVFGANFVLAKVRQGLVSVRC